jgi:serine protease Do
MNQLRLDNKIFTFLSLTLTLIVFSLVNPQSSFSENSTKKYSISTPLSKINTNGFADIVESLLPAVVNISTTQIVQQKDSLSSKKIFDNLPPGSIFENFRDLLENQPLEDKEVNSLGSGFIISKDGYIVTNYHVIDKSNKITVNLSDSRSFEAKVIGTDKKTDLAVLKIDNVEDLPFVKMGDSDNSRIGEWVIAVGNPFGLGGSVSVGIISASGRNISSAKSDDFIQTDAAINKGNSGGPLFNIKGEVIGIATAILSPSGGNVGVGFATPTSIANAVIDQLKSGGEVVRGWLGVSIHEVSEEIAKAIGMSNPRGAFIVEVVKDGPAEKYGILATDIITKFDGQKVQKMRDLPKIVARTEIGKIVDVQVIRQGKSKIFSVKIEKLDEEKIKKDAGESLESTKTKSIETILDIGLANLNKEVRENNQIKEETKGVLIVEIKKNSEASKKGLEKGDIILSANQITISSIKDLQNIIKDLKENKKESILLFVKREKLIKSNNFIQQRSSKFAIILPLK